MRNSKQLSLRVRADLDVLNLIREAGVVIRSKFPDPEWFLRRLGGHPEKSRPVWLPDTCVSLKGEIEMFTLDYSPVWRSGLQLTDFYRFIHRRINSVTGVLVYPEEPLEQSPWAVAQWMHGHGLRPASSYEHLAFVTDHKAIIGDRVVVPFCGFSSPFPCRAIPFHPKTFLVQPEGQLILGNYLERAFRPDSQVCFTAVSV